MNGPLLADVRDTGMLKSLRPVEQAVSLRAFANANLGYAKKLRDAFRAKSGTVIGIRIEGSDEEIVLLALLALVADDIGTVPDATQRSRLLNRNQVVAAELGLSEKDRRLFIENLSIVRETLLG